MKTTRTYMFHSLFRVFFHIIISLVVQSKAMAGDNAVRSLLEKMTQRASSAYLGILERYFTCGIELFNLSLYDCSMSAAYKFLWPNFYYGCTGYVGIRAQLV